MSAASFSLNVILFFIAVCWHRRLKKHQATEKLKVKLRGYFYKIILEIGGPLAVGSDEQWFHAIKKDWRKLHQLVSVFEMDRWGDQCLWQYLRRHFQSSNFERQTPLLPGYFLEPIEDADA